MSVFLDANIPIYAAGRAHPLKAPCIEVLFLASSYPEGFVTDSEVLQEILHRYLAINRWTEGRGLVGEFAELMRDRIVPVLAADVELAAQLADELSHSQARDLVHLAVMRRLGVHDIVSADRGFDSVDGIERLDPTRLPEWRQRLEA